MMFSVEVSVMPHKEILDPQGNAVQLGLHNLGLMGIEGVRIGKKINFTLSAESPSAAEAMVEEACKKLLANLIMESYSYTISAI